MSVEAVARAIAFTEENLIEPVTVGAMADAAHYSLYHFCRIFGRHTGLSPYTYLIRRRLTLAAEALLTTNGRVVEIAHAHQFDSHEGFTRAFGRLYAATPTEARARGWVHAAPRLPPLTPGHLDCLARHGGLAPLPALDGSPSVASAGGLERHEASRTEDVVRVRVPLTWPDVADRHLPGSEAAGVIEQSVVFALTDPRPDDLPLVLDWLLHVWLVVTRHEHAAPQVTVDRAGARVRVPVRTRGVR